MKYFTGLLQFVLIFLTLGSSTSYSEDDENKSCTEVVRNQMQSIADEVVEKIQLDRNIPVIIQVEGEEPHSLVENAFIESLSKNNFSVIAGSRKTGEQVLSISVLKVDIKVKQITEKLMERTIRTSVEVKVKNILSGEVNLLGKFHRVTKDTADSFASTNLSFFGKDNDVNIMQRILTPLIVIGGIVMVVYLFFTVRS